MTNFLFNVAQTRSAKRNITRTVKTKSIKDDKSPKSITVTLPRINNDFTHIKSTLHNYYKIDFSKMQKKH